MRWSRTRLACAYAMLLALAACSEPRQQPPDTAVPVDSAAADSLVLERGRVVYETACAQCHTLEPPPLTAPPLAVIARRYHQVIADREDAIEHLVDYTRSPAPEKSRLSQRTIDEWGVMPGINLPEEDLRAVGRYIWQLAGPRPAG
jgi:mono/diheme cytochrome c family protein